MLKFCCLLWLEWWATQPLGVVRLSFVIHKYRKQTHTEKFYVKQQSVELLLFQFIFCVCCFSEEIKALIG